MPTSTGVDAGTSMSHQQRTNHDHSTSVASTSGSGGTRRESESGDRYLIPTVIHRMKEDDDAMHTLVGDDSTHPSPSSPSASSSSTTTASISTSTHASASTEIDRGLSMATYTDVGTNTIEARYHHPHLKLFQAALKDKDHFLRVCYPMLEDDERISSSSCSSSSSSSSSASTTVPSSRSSFLMNTLLTMHSNKILTALQPTYLSSLAREQVFRHIQNIVYQLDPSLHLFSYGSVPLKTYLPEGDIDIGIVLSSRFSHQHGGGSVGSSHHHTHNSATAAQNFLLKLKNYIEQDAMREKQLAIQTAAIKQQHQQQQSDASGSIGSDNNATADLLSSLPSPSPYILTHLTFINAPEVKILKLQYNHSLLIDISCNTTSALATVCWIEEMEREMVRGLREKEQREQQEEQKRRTQGKQPTATASAAASETSLPSIPLSPPTSSTSSSPTSHNFHKFLDGKSYTFHQHLLKRSIILIKAWSTYESRTLAASHGLLSTYGLEILIIYLLQHFPGPCISPLHVLFMFLWFYGTEWDWANSAVSMGGPIALDEIGGGSNTPREEDEGIHETDQTKDGTSSPSPSSSEQLQPPESLLDLDLLTKLCMKYTRKSNSSHNNNNNPTAVASPSILPYEPHPLATEIDATFDARALPPPTHPLMQLSLGHQCSVSTSTTASTSTSTSPPFFSASMIPAKSFQIKHFNIIDPLDFSNNLGKSVNFTAYLRIRAAWRRGAEELKDVFLKAQCVGRMIAKSEEEIRLQHAHKQPNSTNTTTTLPLIPTSSSLTRQLSGGRSTQPMAGEFESHILQLLSSLDEEDEPEASDDEEENQQVQAKKKLEEETATEPEKGPVSNFTPFPPAAVAATTAAVSLPAAASTSISGPLSSFRSSLHHFFHSTFRKIDRHDSHGIRGGGTMRPDLTGLHADESMQVLATLDGETELETEADEEKQRANEETVEGKQSEPTNTPGKKSAKKSKPSARTDSNVTTAAPNDPDAVPDQPEKKMGKSQAKKLRKKLAQQQQLDLEAAAAAANEEKSQVHEDEEEDETSEVDDERSDSDSISPINSRTSSPLIHAVLNLGPNAIDRLSRVSSSFSSSTFTSSAGAFHMIHNNNNLNNSGLIGHGELHLNGLPSSSPIGVGSMVLPLSSVSQPSSLPNSPPSTPPVVYKSIGHQPGEDGRSSTTSFLNYNISSLPSSPKVHTSAPFTTPLIHMAISSNQPTGHQTALYSAAASVTQGHPASFYTSPISTPLMKFRSPIRSSLTGNHVVHSTSPPPFYRSILTYSPPMKTASGSTNSFMLSPGIHSHHPNGSSTQFQLTMLPPAATAASGESAFLSSSSTLPELTSFAAYPPPTDSVSPLLVVDSTASSSSSSSSEPPQESGDLGGDDQSTDADDRYTHTVQSFSSPTLSAANLRRPFILSQLQEASAAILTPEREAVQLHISPISNSLISSITTSPILVASSSGKKRSIVIPTSVSHASSTEEQNSVKDSVNPTPPISDSSSVISAPTSLKLDAKAIPFTGAAASTATNEESVVNVVESLDDSNSTQLHQYSPYLDDSDGVEGVMDPLYNDLLDLQHQYNLLRYLVTSFHSSGSHTHMPSASGQHQQHLKQNQLQHGSSYGSTSSSASENGNNSRSNERNSRNERDSKEEASSATAATAPRKEGAATTATASQPKEKVLTKREKNLAKAAAAAAAAAAALEAPSNVQPQQQARKNDNSNNKQSNTKQQATWAKRGDQPANSDKTNANGNKNNQSNRSQSNNNGSHSATPPSGVHSASHSPPLLSTLPNGMTQFNPPLSRSTSPPMNSQQSAMAHHHPSQLIEHGPLIHIGRVNPPVNGPAPKAPKQPKRQPEGPNSQPNRSHKTEEGETEPANDSQPQMQFPLGQHHHMSTPPPMHMQQQPPLLHPSNFPNQHPGFQPSPYNYPPPPQSMQFNHHMQGPPRGFPMLGPNGLPYPMGIPMPMMNDGGGGGLSSFHHSLIQAPQSGANRNFPPGPPPPPRPQQLYGEGVSEPQIYNPALQPIVVPYLPNQSTVAHPMVHSHSQSLQPPTGLIPLPSSNSAPPPSHHGPVAPSSGPPITWAQSLLAKFGSANSATQIIPPPPQMPNPKKSPNKPTLATTTNPPAKQRPVAKPRDLFGAKGQQTNKTAVPTPPSTATTTTTTTTVADDGNNEGWETVVNENKSKKHKIQANQPTLNGSTSTPAASPASIDKQHHHHNTITGGSGGAKNANWRASKSTATPATDAAPSEPTTTSTSPLLPTPVAAATPADSGTTTAGPNLWRSGSTQLKQSLTTTTTTATAASTTTGNNKTTTASTTATNSPSDKLK